MKPYIVGPKRNTRRKYPWEELEHSIEAQGWFFVPFEAGHKAQDKSIRAAGRAFGYWRLHIRRASLTEGAPADGWLVERPAPTPHDR